MKKLLVTVIAVVLCLFMLAGCGKEWSGNGIDDFSEGTVSSNGGFLVEKGDYVYFINGVGDSTADNTMGTPCEGSLCRIKKSNLAKSKTAAEISALSETEKATLIDELGNDSTVCEVVIPKIITNSEYNEGTGIFIFGDNVYYATPCNKKNSSGVVRNTEVEYVRTKLNGTDNSVIVTKSSTAPYRFVEIDDTVYLVLKTTNDDNKAVLAVYNAENGSFVKESGVVTSYILASDNDCEYAYYTTVSHNEETDVDESFYDLYRFKLDGTSDEKILSGAGKSVDTNYGIGVVGVKYEFVAFNGSQLFVKETTVDSSSISWYLGANVADFVTEKQGDKPATAVNREKFKALDKGSSSAATIFVATSVYIDLNNIIYFENAFGGNTFAVRKYDFESAVDGGRSTIATCDDISNNTVKFVKNGFVYSVNGEGVYSRIEIGSNEDLKTAAAKGEINATKINYVYQINTSWYAPEIVGDLFITSVTGSPYGSYVFAIDMKATDGMTDDEIEDYSELVNTESEDQAIANMTKLVGVLSSEDLDTFKTYLEDTFAD